MNVWLGVAAKKFHVHVTLITGDMTSVLAASTEGIQRVHWCTSMQACREEYMTECVGRQSQTQHSLQGVGDGGKLKLLSSLDLHLAERSSRPYPNWSESSTKIS